MWRLPDSVFIWKLDTIKKIVSTTFFSIDFRIKLIKCTSFVFYYIRAAAFILGWRLLILLSQMQHLVGGGA